MNFNRFAVVLTAVVFTLPSTSQNLFAADKDDVLATIHQFIDSVDPKIMVAACDSPASIIDEFPPHVWSGPTACADWAKAYGEYNDKNGITPGDVKIGTPWSFDITGDRAYVVVPATYAFKQHGKEINEMHSVLTVALRKTDAGWRITAWSWSKH